MKEVQTGLAPFRENEASLLSVHRGTKHETPYERGRCCSLPANASKKGYQHPAAMAPRTSSIHARRRVGIEKAARTALRKPMPQTDATSTSVLVDQADLRMPMATCSDATVAPRLWSCFPATT